MTQHIELRAEVTGTVWKVLTPVGTRIEAEDTLLVVESMKMEIPVVSEKAGTVVEMKVAEGDAVQDGQLLAVVSI
ncbi:biotin/lipoyl-binding carrier protein [Hydrogenophaga sp.]|uniref:biotin/lipoyl-binding carrier protein n=1 Tax=Hydrogenophaga sp. TaxID=1904254 RepID=UPI002720307C|nr:biotin/lipoyl-binding carrier protein [Hydrogenophaga sp.]MDO9435280.1 biotin/lipoyl-binding carrier protein [Hydrogenophaga sp.]